MPWVASRRTELMLQEAETTYSKAAKSELHGDFDRAFGLYVKAAEAFLHLGQISDDARQRSRCKDHAAKALERAEKIRQARPELRPPTRHHFAEQEQLYVLRKSSLVNNVRFSLWDEDATMTRDTRHPALSPDQRRHSAVWNKVDISQVGLASSPLEPQDIAQHIVTDCSVNLNVWSWHAASDFPWRLKLAIDDQLPQYPDRTLLCLSTGNKRQTWPSLLEKAYMKLMGGYDFPGSDSCVDLHALAGWVPEHVNLRSSTSQRERLWARISQGFYNGSCMLTLGTGENASGLCWDDICLLPAHCYAIIDVSSSPSKREMTILDSWAHSGSGLMNGHDSDPKRESTNTFKLSWDAVCNIFDGVYLSWDPVDAPCLGYPAHLRVHFSACNGDEEPSRSSLEINPSTLKGEYTNNLHTLVRYTASQADQVLHLRDTKAMYSKEFDGEFGSRMLAATMVIRRSWTILSIPTNIPGRVTIGRKYQSRHVNRPAKLQTYPNQRLASVVKGERIAEMGHNELAAHSGPYGFGYANVARDLSAGDYTLVLSSFEPQQLGSFKLRVESQSRFELTPISQEGAGMFNKVIRGAWTTETAGGGPSSSRYATNPLYEVQVDTTTQLKVRLQLLETTPPASINVSLFEHKAPRNSLKTTSGTVLRWRRRRSHAAGRAAARHIPRRASTYNPGLLRAFKLIFYSSAAVKVSAVTRA
ncbi:uncharacterized protein B0H18DRAFT_1121645 [Fomitopsis serialis]|uniref:uncharacterized protein n=1 Tax=Fomitopsis serialis TaxID=139415 RepID=UPI002007F7BC|nr:uncharacterized protein B0H18DRAFT_1121645 [Neoantrodia serialis]KAH9920918.1 hypothetical protein B0H18DRAFT_1121645 [Neoantrodia serialis]